jgi:tRNA nucleotidyltransferase (CCA-adding enzyme)
MKTYLVGGAVRDKLYGNEKENNDQDWVIVGATEADISQLIAEGYTQVGKDFPVFLHPETKEEYALARTERNTGPGYQGFAFDTSSHVTLGEDLARRDFTINAMAMDEDSNVIDPYNGQADLRNRTLRHVSDAFQEDPVRILRAARLTAQYPEFTIAPETMEMMQNMVSEGMVDELQPERMWQELEKSLKGKKPSNFIETLKQCGALEKVMPEIAALEGVDQSEKWHPEGCVYTHNQMVIDRATELTEDPTVRFAAMMHDLGKGITPKELLPKHLNHEKEGIPLVKALCKRMRVPNEYQAPALAATEHHLTCHRALELKAGTMVKLLNNVGAFNNDKGEENLQKFLLACQADAQGRCGADMENYPQAELIQQAYDAVKDISGQQFLDAGKEPGEHIGGMITQERVRLAKEAIEEFKNNPQPVKSKDVDTLCL